MTRFILTASLLAATLLIGGCATKKYVQQQNAPIQAKVDQVGDQTNKNGQQIQQTKTELTASINGVDEKAQSGISAAKEVGHDRPEHRARAPWTRPMMRRTLATQDSEEIKSLRSQVSQPGRL